MNESSLYLAIDQGGHASRALVFDSCGVVAASALVPVATQRPDSVRVEQDPEEIVASVTSAILMAHRELRARTADVRAAGLATQRSSIVCWDRATGRPLSPVISWQDRRGAPAIDQRREAAELVRQRSGLVLSPHYGASKLRWCLDHQSAVRDAADHGTLAWGPLSSFLLARLLRERPHVVDPANASRTLLFDHRSGTWDPELLGLFGLTESALPECVASRHPFGTLPWGGRTVPLAVTTGDQPAALFAEGWPGSDQTSINMGTGAFLQQPAPEVPSDTRGLLCSVAWRDESGVLRVLEGTVNGAGAALDVVGRDLWPGAEMAPQLERWLSTPSEVPLYLNGVGGLGSPWWVSDFPSKFIGTGEPWQQMVAVAESVVFLLAANVDVLRAVGSACTSLRVSGGLSGSAGVCQRLAAVTGIPVVRPDIREATGRGLSFLLAGCPSTWSARQAARFLPAPDARLMARAAAWRAAMDRALGAAF